jgi:hypothetical protein
MAPNVGQSYAYDNSVITKENNGFPEFNHNLNMMKMKIMAQRRHKKRYTQKITRNSCESNRRRQEERCNLKSSFCLLLYFPL